jgi:hypothetical protein
VKNNAKFIVLNGTERGVGGGDSLTRKFSETFAFCSYSSFSRHSALPGIYPRKNISARIKKNTNPIFNTEY